MNMDTKKKGWIKKIAAAVGIGSAAAGAKATLSEREKAVIDMPHGNCPDPSSAQPCDTSHESEAPLSEPTAYTHDEANVRAVHQDAQVEPEALTFGDAFRSARESLGPGGVFEWHGNFYNTYTEEEYSRLTEEDLENLFHTYKTVANGDLSILSASLETTLREDGQSHVEAGTDVQDDGDGFDDGVTPSESDDQPDSDTPADGDETLDFDFVYS